ncbi:MAG: DUF6807 family protein [Candidatus Aminicenantaceae bacterium]
MARSGKRHGGVFFLCLFILLSAACGSGVPEIQLQNDEAGGILRVLISGQEAFVYQYAARLDLAHYWPLNSPSGRNMLVQQTEPYPHHRSMWFADTVRFKGERDVSTYNALYSGEQSRENTYDPPFSDHVRHRSFRRLDTAVGRAVVDSELVWEMDKDRPILNETRHVIVHALGKGEYLLDLMFTLTSAYGDVEFVSDDVHYAWPYLRLQTRFSGENGGVITDDIGTAGQEATNMQVALWIDYSNTLEGITEGVAVFQWPDEQDHRWLTREYGCFGPRRPDAQSGHPFVLEEGESLTQRVGVLVHRGDVKTGRVAERYQSYVSGKWQK